MPLMVSDSPTRDPAVQKWRKVLKTCLQRRVRANQLEHPLRELSQRYRASADDIAEILIRLRPTDERADDPLLLSYLDELGRLRYVDGGAILLPLLRHNRCFERAGLPDESKKLQALPPKLPFEEAVFSLLQRKYLRAFAAGVSGAAWKMHSLIYAIMKWMTACVDHETSMHINTAGTHQMGPDSLAMYEALGLLAVTVLGSATSREVAKQPWWKQRRPDVVMAMKNFATVLSQWMHSRVAPQLHALTGMPPYVETSKDGLPVFPKEHMLQSITDIQHVNSRAGLYIWLNALLCGRPLVEEMGMQNYLQARYNGAVDSLVVDLVLASFDNLTNSLLHREFRLGDELLKSFICNKLPSLLITFIASTLAPANVEMCIQMAFTTISMDPLPPLSQSNSRVREVLTVTRLEFLQACALCGLVSDITIAGILAEPPMALPHAPKLTKAAVITQCAANPSRSESFVEELDSMQGCTGAIAAALVQLIQSHCMSKDTMSLKTLCGALSRRMVRMDVIMLYTTPVDFLLPLCNLLDDWSHDEDQSEYSPLYEEFATIMLLTLATMLRYDITPEQIGILGPDSFVEKILSQLGKAKRPEELTEEQNRQLAKWIQGLYATDDQGETTGIGDEVMSHCPPQAFYLLIPTLFEQSVQACRSKVLSVSTFLGGLEFLLEPFLLPSLIGGLTWLIEHSWEDYQDTEILVQVLQKLLRPTSSSQDTQAMHKTILAIVADPLYLSLKDLSRRMPNGKDVGGLLEAIKPYTNRQRTQRASTAETVQWNRDGGLRHCLRRNIKSLVAWAWTASSGSTGPPPGYVHRLFTTATSVCGPEAVLHAIAAELKEHTAVGHGDLAFDVAVAILSAPPSKTQAPTLHSDGSAHHQNQAPQEVRGVLQLILSDSRQLSEMKFDDAEVLVRLHRRVEAQLTVPQLAQLQEDMDVQGIGNDMLSNLAMTGAGNNAGASISGQTSGDLQTGLPDLTANEIVAVMSQSVDMSNNNVDSLVGLAGADAIQMDHNESFFDELNFDVTQQGQRANTNAFHTDPGHIPNQEEDIFADLDMGDLSDFNFS